MHRRTLSIVLMTAILLLTGLAPYAGSGATAQSATPESALGATPSASGDEIVVTHMQGETTVPANPEVVFSFDITSIDTLQALGVEVDGMPELVGGGEQYMTDDTQVIGSLFEPDYEAINAAQPDLIIVAARSSEAYDDLSDIAPTIDLTNSGAGFIEDLKINTGILAEIFGKQAEAQEMLDAIDARVAALQEQVSGIGTGMVIMTAGGNVTALAPGNARAGRGALIYETLGIQPPLEDIEEATHGEPISFEFLLEHDPDWLFVIDRDAATGEAEGQPAEQVLDNEIVHETTAWQNDQIVYLNAFDWYIITGGGLDSTQRMLTELEAAFGA
ncbi:MAG TPA: ABC transporter substrate-binding protein [Thermomicrobiales bacterium]|nr:ABC transporter substrate-binding protein [Thermomicrobiales bacterium]